MAHHVSDAAQSHEARRGKQRGRRAIPGAETKARDRRALGGGNAGRQTPPYPRGRRLRADECPAGGRLAILSAPRTKHDGDNQNSSVIWSAVGVLVAA